MNVKLFQELTRFKQALFGLPFTLAGVTLGCRDSECIIWSRLIWVLPAFLFLRSAGMAFNQLIDRKIDAANPRTRHRVIPSGRLSTNQVRWIAWSSLILFMVFTASMNRSCLLLAPVAALLVYLYSYTKRFTWGCHFVLGSIHFLGPVMAYALLTNQVNAVPCLIGAGAFFMIAGNDIIYAFQDLDFDRTQHIYSIPSRFGVKRGVQFARLLQTSSLVMFFLSGLFAHFSWVYWVGFSCGGISVIIMQRIQSSEAVLFFGNCSVSLSILCAVLGGSL